jgi:hypothetical protein
MEIETVEQAVAEMNTRMAMQSELLAWQNRIGRLVTERCSGPLDAAAHDDFAWQVREVADRLIDASHEAAPE